MEAYFSVQATAHQARRIFTWPVTAGNVMAAAWFAVLVYAAAFITAVHSMVGWWSLCCLPPFVWNAPGQVLWFTHHTHTSVDWYLSRRPTAKTVCIHNSAPDVWLSVGTFCTSWSTAHHVDMSAAALQA
jgi:hypothetical protein